MGALAALILVAGIVCLIWGAMQRYKASRIAKAPFVKTGEAAQKGTAAAGERGAISVEGGLTCPELLTSPVTGTACLYYEVRVVATWKEGDSQKEKEISHEKVAAPFALDDGSGPVTIDVSAGDADTEETYSKEQGVGVFKGLAGGELVFGNFKVQTGILKIGTKYRVTEKVLKASPKMFVVGRATEHNTIASPKWTSIIVSPKSRDELFGATLKASKGFLIGGSAAAGVGLILGLVATLTAKPKPAHAETPVKPPIAAVGGGGAALSAAECKALVEHVVDLVVNETLNGDPSYKRLKPKKKDAQRASLKAELLADEDHAKMLRDCQSDYSRAAYTCFMAASTDAQTDRCRDL